MKLLFIFTGGTIGSTLRERVMSAGESKAYAIINAYEKRYGISFDYDIDEPYVELSENNTGRHIRTLCEAVRRGLCGGYDGIIVTHGSDTLQYSAAAVGYTIGLDTPPVCLVAANAPIEDESSNALDNLCGAVRFIEDRLGRGAFAVYRNAAHSRVRVHRATRLIGGKAYSDDLSSAGKCIYGEFDENFVFCKNPKYIDQPDGIEPFDPSCLSDCNRNALMLFSYPGMVYPEIGEDVRYIIFNTYHSGTLNTSSAEALEFFAKAKERGIPVYATGNSEGPQYSSVERFGELGIIPVTSLSPVAAYIKLWFAYSSGRSPREALAASLSSDLLFF